MLFDQRQIDRERKRNICERRYEEGIRNDNQKPFFPIFTPIVMTQTHFEIININFYSHRGIMMCKENSRKRFYKSK
jgi:hypothetical protein